MSPRGGTVIGVGVGPGDPELMTLKAYRIISDAEIVAYLAADASDGLRESRARSIAAEAISESAIEIEIRMPMRPARAAAQAAYDHGAAEIAAHLQEGRDVAVLCEGDPLFYGSFMYLLARLTPRFEAQIIPGVSSPMAAAAAIATPLTARAERFAVIPSTADLAEIEATLRNVEAAALLKLGRRLPEIRALIDQLGMTDRAFYVESASAPGQVAVPLSRAPKTAPYFSLILIVGEDVFAHAR